MGASSERIGSVSPEPGYSGGMPRPELRGRAVGLIVLSCFAFSWSGWGTSEGVSSAVQISVLVLAGALTVLLIVGAVVVIRRSGSFPAGPDRAGAADVGGRFGLVVGVEFGALAGLSAVLGAGGHQNLIPTVFCLGVGVHFIPLARLFGVRLYYWTGAVMGLVAGLTLVVAPLAGHDSLWTALPGLGSAVSLYATSGVLLAGCCSTLRSGPGLILADHVTSRRVR